MRKINTLIFLILCFSFMLTSCGREAVRITREEAMPIQNAIDGVLGKDTALYRSAFPIDYDTAVEGEEAMWKYENSTVYTDFNGYLNEMLIGALEADRVNYGKNIGMEFIVESVTEIDPEEYPSYFKSYDDIYVYYYTLDISSVEKAVKITGKLNIWGDKDEASSAAEFIVLYINGVWYLHPMYYYTTFY